MIRPLSPAGLGPEDMPCRDRPLDPVD